MRCANCGYDVPDGNDTNFCPRCGARLASVQACPFCGARITPDAAFCPKCGRPVRQAQAQPQNYQGGQAPVQQQYQQAPAQQEQAAEPPAYPVPEGMREQHYAEFEEESRMKRSVQGWKALRVFSFLWLFFYSFLLFVSFLTSVYSSADSVFSTGYGGVAFYTILMSPDNAIFGTCAALVVIALLSFVLSCVFMLFAMKEKRSGLTGHWLARWNIFSVIAAALYLAGIIVSAVLTSKASGIAGNYGMCCSLCTYLSVVFLLLAAVIIIAVNVRAPVCADEDVMATYSKEKLPADRSALNRYTATKIVRDVLFLVFSVLLFIFFAINVTATNNVSDGKNLYLLLGDSSYGLQGCMWAMLIIAIISLLYGIAMVIKDVTVKVSAASGKTPDILSAVMTAVSIALLLALLVASRCAAGLLHPYDLIYDIVDAGKATGPCLYIIAAGIFIVLIASVICQIFDMTLSNKYDFTTAYDDEYDESDEDSEAEEDEMA